MNHSTDAHSSSSQSINILPWSSYLHHIQCMAGHVPKGPIVCDAQMFGGSTIRAEMKEIQKADIGRVCIFDPTPWWLLDFGSLH